MSVRSVKWLNFLLVPLVCAHPPPHTFPKTMPPKHLKATGFRPKCQDSRSRAVLACHATSRGAPRGFKGGILTPSWRPFQSVSMESDTLALLYSLASSVSRWKQPFIVGIGAESIAEPSSANSFSSGMRSAEPLIMHRLDMTPHRHSIA